MNNDYDLLSSFHKEFIAKMYVGMFLIFVGGLIIVNNSCGLEIGFVFVCGSVYSFCITKILQMLHSDRDLMNLQLFTVILSVLGIFVVSMKTSIAVSIIMLLGIIYSFCCLRFTQILVKDYIIRNK